MTEGFEVHPRHIAVAAELAVGYRVFLQFAKVHVCGQRRDRRGAVTPKKIDECLLELVKDQVSRRGGEQSAPVGSWALLGKVCRSLRFHLKDVGSDDAPKIYPWALAVGTGIGSTKATIAARGSIGASRRTRR